tara:strand:- start:1653 stop:2261 length:609 start_codon:yes stop_codon:yes gene_type:complete
MPVNIPGQLRDPQGKVVRVNAVSTEPIVLAKAKEHLRVTSTDDDTYITTLIQVAREMVEKHTRQIWTASVFNVYYDDFPSTDTIVIPDLTNISAVTVHYEDQDDNTQTFAATEYYTALDTTPARIVKKTNSDFPSTSNAPGAVRVNVTTAAPSTGVPRPIIQAMFMLIGHFYENRQEVVDRIQYQMPNACEFLLSPYRIYTT